MIEPLSDAFLWLKLVQCQR